MARLDKLFNKFKTPVLIRAIPLKSVPRKKLIGFLYRKCIDFLPNENIDLKCPTSERFLTNLFSIYTNKPVVHHLHVSGKILGFVHDFCNSKVRENYYTIPVIAHNQFRFDFFFFLKGIRPTVWETTRIKIGAKNASNINFALIGNQFRFIDTIKYFQQNLGNVGASMTDTEKKYIKKLLKEYSPTGYSFLKIWKRENGI